MLPQLPLLCILSDYDSKLFSMVDDSFVSEPARLEEVLIFTGIFNIGILVNLAEFDIRFYKALLQAV